MPLSSPLCTCLPRPPCTSSQCTAHKHQIDFTLSERCRTIEALNREFQIETEIGAKIEKKLREKSKKQNSPFASHHLRTAISVETSESPRVNSSPELLNAQLKSRASPGARSRLDHHKELNKKALRHWKSPALFIMFHIFIFSRFYLN